MENFKISVIVPVYNTSKYLEKCLDSLINQTYKELEIIIVEDCSTDNSKSLLEKYKKFENVTIIYNDRNMGLSYSRNVGLAHAGGNYIGYIDSDDYVQSDYYEKLIMSIKNNHSDVAICDVKVIYEDTKEEIISKCCNSDNFSLVNIIDNGLAASACNKLFKRSLLSKYKFSEGKVNEDIAVVIPIMCNAKKISYAKDCYYNYIQHFGSIQNSSFSNKRFDIIDGVDLTLQRIKNNSKYNEIKNALIFNQIIVLLIYVIPKEQDFSKRYNFLKRYVEFTEKYKVRQNPYFWKFLENCGKKHKIYYKALFKFAYCRLYFCANLLISLYNIFAKMRQKKTVIKKNILLEDIIRLAKKQNDMGEEKIKISVVVPNYNYERFLLQRIYSILSQNYKLYEIIILDDNSKDNSVELIKKIESAVSKYVNIKLVINKENSGSAFKQWQKGFEIANGDYLWIAEADDYCEKNLIRNLVKPISKSKNVIISYSDTAFINTNGNIILKSIKPEIDIQKTGHWNKNYQNNGISEIENYCFLNNTIANVSSSIIKNGKYGMYLEKAGTFKQCGDWYLYVKLIENGDICYTDKILNYYRVHGNNVSSTMNKNKHIDEIDSLYSSFMKDYKLSKHHKKLMNDRIKFLKKAWKVK